MQGYFSFFRKIVIEYLNINSLLKGGLFCKIETRVFYDIKRMREEKGGSQPRGEKHPLL